MKAKLKIPVVLAGATLYVSLAWALGLVVLVVGLLRAVRRFRRMRVALAAEISCPWCGVEVPQYGAYGCLGCRARTLGWAWRCSCGAWAGHIQCTNPDCGLSVRNPLLPAP